jgi:hypothetical protein
MFGTPALAWRYLGPVGIAFCILGCGRQSHQSPGSKSDSLHSQAAVAQPSASNEVVTDTIPYCPPFDSTAIGRLTRFQPTDSLVGIAGSDSCHSYELGIDDHLHLFTRYAVRYRSLRDLGCILLVYGKAPGPDSAFLLNLNRTVPIFGFQSEAEYFMGMRDSLLFTDLGTADIRGALVYNVLRRKKVFDGTYANTFWLSSPDTLAYYEILKETPDPVAYPEAAEAKERGNTPLLLELVKVSLNSFSKVRTGTKDFTVMD